MSMTVPQDFTFAVRQFRRSPGFTVSVILTLALGIGACTAIFSVVDGILFRPLPFPHAEQLVAISTLEFPVGMAGTDSDAAIRVDTSYPNYFDWQRRNLTFQSLGSYEPTPRLFSKLSGDDARVMPAARVSADLLTTLGMAPALGRAFTHEEEQPGHRVVILSYDLWVSDFAASPDAIGQIVKISDEASTIVGVMPADFHYPIEDSVKFWTTFAADAEGPEPRTSARDRAGLSIVGRLKAGVSIEQGVADVNAIQRGIAQQYSEDKQHLGVSARPILRDAVPGGVRWSLWLLLASVGLVVLIVCANVAGLLLARANGRRAELALRAALGASRLRIVRQLLLESLLLAMSGGVAGILLSFALLHAALHFVPVDLPRTYNIAIDGRILAFAILLSAATSLIFGLLPAWRMSQLSPANALREGGPNTTSSHRSSRLRSTLVVTETALGFVLLISSGLLVRSMINVLQLDPGFDTQHTVAFDIALTNTRYPDPSKIVFFDKLLPQLAALPGVEKVSIGHPMPITWYGNSWTRFTVPGHPDSPDKLPVAIGAVVGADYFETLSIPLIRGRTLNVHDNSSKSAPVAVINQSLARRYFPGEDPIGRYFVPRLPEGQPDVGREIVGIVGDIRTNDIWNPYRPQFFMPYAQDPEHQRPLVVMKVAGDPASYESAARRVVANVDKDTPIFRYRPFAEDMDRQVAQPRFEAMLISAFALVALVLAAVGLYALLSYLVSEKTRELGVRMALGASRAHILQLVMWRGLWLACLGILIGAAASLFAARLVANNLFHVNSLDRQVFLVTTIVLAAVSMSATLVPALRATHVDPMRALRDQ